MLTEIMRHVLYRRRVRAARAWSDAARRQVAEHSAAVQRIVDHHSLTPTDAGRIVRTRLDECQMVAPECGREP